MLRYRTPYINGRPATIPEIFREIACQLTEYTPLDSGAVAYARRPSAEPWYFGSSSYICDRLSHLDEPDTLKAAGFLAKLGMSTGHLTFGLPQDGYRFTAEQQHQRAAWLYFAADLWEEWEGTGPGTPLP